MIDTTHNYTFTVPEMPWRVAVSPPKTAIIITNYNMPERTDKLVAAFARYIPSNSYELIVVDNGSDLVAPSRYTTIRLLKNRQTCGGWLAGLDYADFLKIPFFAYWIWITSAEYAEHRDILTPMVQFLYENEDAAIIHPSLTADSTTAWDHLKTRGEVVRRTWMVDNIAALYNASWFNQIGRFDPKLTYAWGTDLESCYIARRTGKSIWVDDRAQVRKITNIGYSMDRMRETAQKREAYARAEMAEILSAKYGSQWDRFMREGYVQDDWR